MWVSKKAWAVLLLMAVVASVGMFSPSQAAARVVDKPRDDAKQGCIQHKDGTKDCTPIFIEVGEPVIGVQATCSGYGCDGQWPYDAGCAVSYGVIDSRYIYNSSNQQVGYVQLWWSNTCQTNWARTVKTASYNTYLDAMVVRDNNNNRVADSPDTSYHGYISSGGTAVYSPMVYAPNLVSLADGLVDPYSARTAWK